jgi:hypothetical protein
MPLGGMFTDSSSPVSDGHVFTPTWRDLLAPAVPQMRGILSQSRIEELLLGGPDARALPVWASQNLDSISQNGCQVGGDCNSLAGELRSAL